MTTDLSTIQRLNPSTARKYPQRGTAIGQYDKIDPLALYDCIGLQSHGGIDAKLGFFCSEIECSNLSVTRYNRLSLHDLPIISAREVM